MTCQEFKDLKSGPRDFADLLPSERVSLANHYWDCRECRAATIAGHKRELASHPLNSIGKMIQAAQLAAIDGRRVDPEL